jgi:hypothetical protein
MENEKQIHEQFASLPLSEKISILFRMELATISDAINYFAKEPMKVAEKVGDVITDFGNRVEAEFRKATKTADEPAKDSKKKSGKDHDEPAEGGNDTDPI